MFKIISLWLILFVSCATSMEKAPYKGTFVSVENRKVNGGEAVHTIQIEFLDNSKCKILVAYGMEFDDETIFRYIIKSNIVLMKNISTGKWTKLNFKIVDENSFKIEVFETDSSKTWRVFHQEKIPPISG